MEFSYLYRKRQAYPIIPLKITIRQSVLKTEALIDSGANISVFSSGIADYFSLNLTSGKLIYLQGIGGRIAGYIHKVVLSVGKISFPCPIFFRRTNNNI